MSAVLRVTNQLLFSGVQKIHRILFLLSILQIFFFLHFMPHCLSFLHLPFLIMSRNSYKKRPKCKYNSSWMVVCEGQQESSIYMTRCRDWQQWRWWPCCCSLSIPSITSFKRVLRHLKIWYDSRSDSWWIGRGYSPGQCAGFQDDESIESITLRKPGSVEMVGGPGGVKS